MKKLFNHGKIKIVIFIVGLVVGFTASQIWVFYPVETGSVKKETKTKLLILETTQGGLCGGLYGSGVCESETKVYENGLVTKTNYLFPDFSYYFLTSKKVFDLKNLIKNANIDEIFESDFKGDCPINYDGQEVVLEVYLNGKKKMIASCSNDFKLINNNLFVEINDL